MRKSTFLWLLLAVVCGCMLFRTSQEVTDGRAKLAAIEAATRKEDESIRVLEAEWSYLNQPDRLEKLSRQYLELAPLKGRQFSKVSALDDKTAAPAADEAGMAASAAPVENEEAETTVDASTGEKAEAAPPEKTPEKTPDKSAVAAAPAPAIRIDKASTAETATPLLKTKAKPAAAHAAAKAPTRNYVYSPPAKPYAKPVLPYGGTKYAGTPYAAPQPAHDSQRGFGDVLKSLGGN